MATAEVNESKIDVKTVIEWSFKLISMIILPLVIWMITLLLSVDKRISIMEGNRFTATDGIELREDVTTIQRDILDIRTEVDGLVRCQIHLRTGNPGAC